MSEIPPAMMEVWLSALRDRDIALNRLRAARKAVEGISPFPGRSELLALLSGPPMGGQRPEGPPC